MYMQHINSMHACPDIQSYYCLNYALYNFISIFTDVNKMMILLTENFTSKDLS